MTLKIKDSLTKKMKTITGDVSMYVCGPTVYDFCHLGHGRSYINFDFLRRIMLVNSKITSFKYCQNITDICDKIRNKGQKMGLTELETANYYIKAMHHDLALLNVLKPDIEPRVSEHINEISIYIEKLLANKKAYKTKNTIYFDTQSIDYGFFQKYDDPKNRIDGDEEKKYYKDFALWKLDPSGYESSLGKGFPGWHIECSAMMTKHLGKNITIHGGGVDLKHTHHENEIAQSIGCYDCQPADIWIHNEMIHTQGVKMSKSLQNCQYLKDFIGNKFQGDILRYLVLSYDIDSIINFTEEKWEQTKKIMLKWRKAFYSQEGFEQIELSLDNATLIKKGNELLKENKISQFRYLVTHMGFAMKKNDPIIIKQMKEDRAKARKEKNYKLSDKIRLQLINLGENIED